MKEPFIFRVNAATPEAAHARAKDATKKQSFRLVLVTEDVEHEVKRKLHRVLENGSLYADKVAAYEKMLDAWKVSDQGPEARAKLMLAHGDVRVDHPSGYGMMQVAPGTFLAFGFHFDR